MTTAAEIMHADVTCIGQHESLAVAAARMREAGVGALPICGDDNRLHGMITDRDIVIKCVAAGKDPKAVDAGTLAEPTTYHAAATAGVEDLLSIMEEHRIRRLPIIDMDHRLVGIVSEADIARHLPDHSVAHFVKTICAERV